jgi:ADP-heptose:LPS heptosyltransferase
MADGRKRLLVIKLDAIGDFILWLDFAKGLREFYPSATHEVTLVGNRAWADLAEKLPYFDRVVPIDRMGFILNPLYRFRMMFRIRRGGFDTVVDPTFSREFPLSPSIVRVCGAKTRMAPQGDTSNQRPWQKRLSDCWYSRLFPSSGGRLMELQRNAEFLRALGHKGFRAGLPELRLAGLSPREPADPYYIIFPGAGWVNRQWPVENFAALATLIYRASGWKGMVCGGKGETALAERLKSLTDASLDDMTGRTTLTELASLIAGARFLVGNETSAVHLAAAVSTPAVCILGGGHFGRFVPYVLEEETERPVPTPVYHEMACYGCNWNCIFRIEGEQPVPCVANVTVEAAWECVRRLILF